MRKQQLRTALEQLFAERSPRHLANDPLSFCHRYEDPADREVVAVIASAFAYGAVGIILRSLEKIFSELGPSPRRFVAHFDPRRGLSRFHGFKHRFNDGRDLCALLWSLRIMIEQAGSVEAFFLAGHSSRARDVGESLTSYSTRIKSFNYHPVFGGSHIPEDSSFLFFFPAPSSGSACKRLCMFLRWVVRPADGIDLGLWRGIRPAQLVIPLDTHIQRISRYLGLTSRKTADWRMATEITAALRRLDPDDPVKYDFSLAHLGISERCDGIDTAICETCPIKKVCPRSIE